MRARPTAAFGGLLFVLFAMWYAASSQNNAVAYLLFFSLLGVVAISLPHAVLNIARLTATAEAPKPAFAGDEVSLPVEIVNNSRRMRRAVCVSFAGLSSECVAEIAPGKAVRVTLRFPAKERGEHEVGNLCLASSYPLGFLRAAKTIVSRQRHIVYPRPVGDQRLPEDRSVSERGRLRRETGEGDEFAGVRSYLPGESQRHIDWKAVARGQPLMTKQYAASESGAVYFDPAQVPSADAELRLGQLALWIIEAERARRAYGLRLPGIEITSSLGELHCHRCLRALALSA